MSRLDAFGGLKIADLEALLRFCQSLYGLPANTWCDKVYNHINKLYEDESDEQSFDELRHILYNLKKLYGLSPEEWSRKAYIYFEKIGDYTNYDYWKDISSI